MVAFGVVSESADYGRDPEEGSPVIALVYFIMAEFKDGRRLRHNVNFPTLERVEDEDVGYSFRRRYDAEERAERLLRRIEARGEITDAHWNESYPVYGSDAYIAADAEGDHIAWERRAEEDSRFSLAHVG